MPEQSAGGSLAQSAATPRVERPVVDRADQRAEPEDHTQGAVDGWRRALAGADLPDTLVVSGPGATSAWLDLTHAHPSGLAQLFAGRQTRLSSLFREQAAHAAAWRQARSIRSSAVVLSAQRGVQGCCLSVGVAAWLPPGATAPDGVAKAPVVLRGCAVRPRGAGNEDFDLELDDAVLINPELVRSLVEDFGVAADAAHLAGLAHGPKGFDPRPVYAWLEEHCEAVPSFTIERSLVLATFAAGSGAVIADLEAAVPAIREHRLLGRVALAAAPAVVDLAAGEPAPAGPADLSVERLEVQPDDERPAPAVPSPAPVGTPAPGENRRLAMVGRLGPRGVLPVKPPAEPDPAQDLLVLDLDPSQRAAVDAVLRGDDVLVEGPPGSGVTHTLAASIARLVAAGRSVLVLSPRRASTEALLARLRAAGVDDLVLDLRESLGGPATPNSLLTALQAASGPIAALPRPGRAGDDDGAAETLRRVRRLLDDEVEALHEVRDPWGVSLYDAMVALAELSGRPEPPQTPVRLDTALLKGLDGVTRERLRTHLQAAAQAGAFTLSRADTRWFDAAVTSAVQARAALEAALILRSGLDRARTSMDGVTSAAGLHPAHHASGWLPLLELLLGVRLTVDVMQPQVYEHDLELLADANAPRGERSGVELGRGERRRLRKAAQALVRPGVHVPDLYGVLCEARDQKRRWAQFAVLPELPRVVVGLSEAEAAVRRAMSALDVLADAFDGSSNADPRVIPLDDLHYRVHDLAGDQDGILGQPRRATLVDGLRQAGLGAVVDDFRERRVGVERVDAELDQLWWASVRESIVDSDERLARRDPAGSRRATEELRDAQAELIATGAAQVRSAVAARAAKTVARHGDQVELLRAELGGPDARPRVVDLVRACGDVLGGLAPVWVMTPDTVAAALAPADPELGPLVDTVVVDDAGFIGTAEVVAALARGAQVVVGGDRRRQTSVAGGGPSLAEAVAAFATVCRLERDHRAADGRMLLPLVAHYREGWQLTPGVEALPPLTLEPVTDGMAVPPPGEELPISADAEVNRVVDLVEEHAVNRPEESLVVVTLSERHAERIDEALRAHVVERPALARWLEAHRRSDTRERFLVRPVDRALGVERDAAILAVGIARTMHGRVLHRFGPLDGEHGAAGLIAGLSRARLRTTVVCCFTAADLVVDRLRTPGARLLRDVLLAAAGRTSARSGRSTAGVDGLVGDLRSRLAAAGLPVQSRVGDRAWPLDLALADPRLPGRMLVGLDVDGPAFSGRSCGERERLRPQRWERAGWSYLKISAIDYFTDPALEVERVRSAYEQALARPVADDFGPPPVPSDEVEELVVPEVLDDEEDGEADIEPVEPVAEEAVAEEAVAEEAVAEEAVAEEAVAEEAVAEEAVAEEAVAEEPVDDLGPMIDPDPPELDDVPPLPSSTMKAGPEDEQTRDDTDEGWGETPGKDRDEELERERPPHWE